MTEPSTDEIRDVVIAWAHAEGYLTAQLPGEHGKRWEVGGGSAEHGFIAVVATYDKPPMRNITAVMCDFDSLLVWTLAVVSGLTADVGVCTSCDGDVVLDSGGVTPWGEGINVRCNACLVAPGREVLHAGYLVMIASGDWPRRDEHEQAREHLLAFADRWQSDGEPLGFAVAHWLADVGEWRRAALDSVRAAWERATVPCERCKGKGQALRVAYSFSGARLFEHGPLQTCPDCDGYGRVRSERG